MLLPDDQAVKTEGEFYMSDSPFEPYVYATTT